MDDVPRVLHQYVWVARQSFPYRLGESLLALSSLQLGDFLLASLRLVSLRLVSLRLALSSLRLVQARIQLAEVFPPLVLFPRCGFCQ